MPNENYPLFYKNFPGADLSIVSVRIVDIINDEFVIEFQSGNRTTVKQQEFIEFHNSIETSSLDKINF